MCAAWHQRQRLQSNPASPVFIESSQNTDTVQKKPINLLFLSKPGRRRAASEETPEDGKPFIKLHREADEKPKRSFFMIPESQSPVQSPDTIKLASSIGALTPQQCFYVCNLFNICPPTQTSLLQFVEHYAFDPVILKKLKTAMLSTYISPNIPPMALNATNFLDVRYFPTNTSFEFKPLYLGETAVDISFQLPTLNSDLHIVLQCFLSDSLTKTLCWPQSLRILINNHQIKNVGQFRSAMIDLSKFGQNTTVRIICGVEPGMFFLEAKTAKFTKYSDIIEKIKTKPVYEHIPDGSVSLLDPISGDILKNPARGSRCTHPQCFELSNFLRIANASRNWVCPICKQALPPSEIIFSKATANLLAQAIEHHTVNADVIPPLSTEDVIMDDSFTVDWALI